MEEKNLIYDVKFKSYFEKIQTVKSVFFLTLILIIVIFLFISQFEKISTFNRIILIISLFGMISKIFSGNYKIKFYEKEVLLRIRTMKRTNSKSVDYDEIEGYKVTNNKNIILKFKEDHNFFSFSSQVPIYEINNLTYTELERCKKILNEKNIPEINFDSNWL